MARREYLSRPTIARTALALGLIGVLAGCARPATNFSQHPGFAEWFRDNPPSSAPPGAADLALAERYRPRFLLPPGHPGPVDFYRDYVANGRLYDPAGRLVSSRVDAALLDAHKLDPGVEFVHDPPRGATPAPVVYARVDRAPVPTGAGQGGPPFTFVTYHAVFRHSGLPAAFGGLAAAALDLVADLDDWHQLDHYTAVSLVLDDAGRPCAVMMQQHNYVRTWLIGEGVALPADDRVRVDVAERSNELYPHVAGRTLRRAVRFADFEGTRYLMGFGGAPRVAADDVTDGRTQVDYRLETRAHDDAFYVFAGFLGERRRLPGRSGPPGADYNTLPALKPLGLQLLAGYWREGDAGDWERYRGGHDGGAGADRRFALAQAVVFHHNRRCLAARRAGCELR